MTDVKQIAATVRVEQDAGYVNVTQSSNDVNVTSSWTGVSSLATAAWAASTSYAVDRLVTYRGNLYRCTVAHTSGASWSSTNWTRMTSGGQQLGAVESILGVGDSRFDFGSTAEDGAGRPYIWNRIASRLGVPSGRQFMYARRGTDARWGGWRVFQSFDPGARKWPYSARVGAVFVSHGGNDLAYGVDDGGWREWSFKQGLISEILRGRVARTFQYDDTTISYATGTWLTGLFATYDPTSAPGQGTGAKATNTAGSIATITTPTDMGRGQTGTWVDLYFVAKDSGATGTVYLDGTLYTTLNAGLGTEYGTAYQHGYTDVVYNCTLYTVRVYVPTTYATGSNTTTTAHTIEVRFGAAVNSGYLIFNGWAIEADVPPATVVANVVQIPNTSGLAMGGQYADATVATTYNTWITEACASILTSAGAADPSVVVADVWTALGGSGWTSSGTTQPTGSNRNYFLTDGIHTDHEGSAIYADTVLDALTEALQLDLDYQNIAGSAVGDEHDPLTEAPFWHIGAGAPVSVIDTFERADSEAALGGSWTELSGAWGVDSQGQAYCVDPKFPHYVVRDDFTRTSTTSLSTVEWDTAVTARSWSAANGTWGTTGTKAYVATSAVSGHDVALLELSSATTQSVEAQLATTVGGAPDHQGLILRYVDSSNYLLVTGSSLACKAHTVVAGVQTTLGTFGGAGVGLHFRAEIGSDNVLRCWNSETGVPSTTTFTITDAALLHSGSGTKVGMWVSSSATPTSTDFTFDEFKAGTTAAHTDTRTAGAMSLAVIDQGTATGIIGIQQGWYGGGGLLDINGSAGIAARIVDPLNGYYLGVTAYGYWSLYKVTAGTHTLLGYWWIGNYPGTIVYLKMSGNDFSVYDSTGTLKTRADGSGLTTITDATHAGTKHGIYHPYHDDASKARWEDWRFGQALTEQPPVRGDMRLDNTNAPDSVVLYGPYEDGAWGSGTTIGLTSAQSAEFIRDTIGTALIGGTGIGSTVSDGSDTITLDLDTAQRTRTIRCTIDGQGSVLTTGACEAYVTVPFTGTITEWKLLADTSGAVVVDIWKDTYANYPPTNADSITASDKPTISASGTKATGSSLTGWTTAVTAGDVLEFEIESVASITKLVVELTVTVS